ncbi:MAG TPA: hypothetical protein H9684_02745 [Firmicutes bacterium]|nr:hypothetical protein [Bacillota bacterium]
MPLIEFLSATASPDGANTPASMLFACWAIVIVLWAMVVIFLRAKKKEYAVAILPLLIAPAVHIFSGVAAAWLGAAVALTAGQLRIIIDLTAGLISCLLLGLVSRGIEDRRARNGFFWCCAGFVVILTLVLVTNTLTAIVHV